MMVLSRLVEECLVDYMKGVWSLSAGDVIVPSVAFVEDPVWCALDTHVALLPELLGHEPYTNRRELIVFLRSAQHSYDSDEEEPAWKKRVYENYLEALWDAIEYTTHMLEHVLHVLGLHGRVVMRQSCINGNVRLSLCNMPFPFDMMTSVDLPVDRAVLGYAFSYAIAVASHRV